MGILNKLRHIFSNSALLLVYFALVHPYLPYNVPIWRNTFPTIIVLFLQKFNRLQNKALHIISNCNPKILATSLFYRYKILKIQDLYYFEIAKIMHQYSKKSLPICFTSFFTQTSVIDNHSTINPTFETIYIYLTSHRLDVKDQLNFKKPKSGTPSLLIFKINHLIRSNVILKFIY